MSGQEKLKSLQDALLNQFSDLNKKISYSLHLTEHSKSCVLRSFFERRSFEHHMCLISSELNMLEYKYFVTGVVEVKKV